MSVLSEAELAEIWALASEERKKKPETEEEFLRMYSKEDTIEPTYPNKFAEIVGTGLQPFRRDPESSPMDISFWTGTVADPLDKSLRSREEPSVTELAFSGTPFLPGAGGLPHLAKAAATRFAPAAKSIFDVGRRMQSLYLPQNITRRDEAMQPPHPSKKASPANQAKGYQTQAEWESAEQVKAGFPPQKRASLGQMLSGDWYSGDPTTQARHLAMMGGRVVKDLINTTFSPQAAYTKKMYGIGPSVGRKFREYIHLLKQEDNYLYPKTNVQMTFNRMDRARNELRSGAANIMVAFSKYGPDDPRRARFEEGVSEHVIPVSMKSRAEDAVANPNGFRVLFDLPDQFTDDAIKTHLSPHIINDLKLKGDTDFVIKPYESSPAKDVSDLTFKADDGKKYKKTVLSDFKTLWGASSGDVSKKSLIDLARQLNRENIQAAKEAASNKVEIDKAYRAWLKTRESGKIKVPSQRQKRNKLRSIKKELYDKAILNYPDGKRPRIFYDLDRLEKAIIDEGGFLSVGGKSLSEDRLLGTVSNRLMLSKTGDWGGWFRYDIMKQGADETSKMLGIDIDKILDSPSKANWVAMEVRPVTRVKIPEGKRKLAESGGRESGKPPQKTGLGMVETEEGLMGITGPESQLKHFDRDRTFQELSDAILSKLDDKAPMSYRIKRLLWQGALGYGGYEVLSEN